MKLLRFRDWPLRVKVLVVLGIFSVLPLVIAGLMIRKAAIRNADHALKLWADYVQDKLEDFHVANTSEARRLQTYPLFSDPDRLGKLPPRKWNKQAPDKEKQGVLTVLW